MEKLILIDTFNFLYRAYHALPKTFTDSQGNPTNAIYGVTSMLINIFETIQPTYAVAALESKETPVARLEQYDQYKAHRKPMDEELVLQIEPVIEVMKAFGVYTQNVEGYEADDIIGTITTRLKDQDIEIIIASNDRDLWQLVRENVLIMLPNTKGNVEWLGAAEVDARLGFSKDYLITYKSLKGDPSDNIPGVAGIGDKTAKDLIAQFGDIDSIYANITSVESSSTQKKLLDNRDMAFVSKDLATIQTDVPFDFDLSSCRYSQFNKLDVQKVLEKYNFKSLIRRLGLEPAGSGKKETVIPKEQVGLF